MDAFVGRVLDGRYRVEELIARGGMATVYRAYDLRLERSVALKVLSPTLASDAAFVDRFLHEARATAALMHPNVVAVHDQGVTDGFPYLVMEYVPGRTLREVLRATGPLTAAHALEIMKSVLAGLSAAHQAGFVHRDIKPENVLITNNGHVKVTDFGIARAIDSAEQSRTGAMILGTMAYVSPESVSQQPLDARSDVYSCGILLYELVTGQVPFTAPTPLEVAYQHVNDRVPPPSATQHDVPPVIDHLVLAATTRDPADRFQTAEAFRDAVRTAATAVPAAEALTTVLPVSPTLIQQERGTGAHRRTAAVARPAMPTQYTGTGLHRIPPPKAKWRLGRIAALLVTLLAIAGSAWYFLAGSYATMPQVVGLTVEQAATKLAPLDLPYATQEEFSEDVDKGIIIETLPTADAKARKGRNVTLVVSKGKERYLIPSDLDGISVAAATAALERLTLVVAGTKEVFSDNVAKGKVVGTDPEGGQKVKRATEVMLLISKGPAPVAIPKIIGKSVDEATAALSKVGLTMTVSDQVFDDSPAGSIVSANPSPGTEVDKGSTIAVVVSKGPPLVNVPNVVGMGKDAAIKKLEEAGFKVKVENQLSVVVLKKVYSQDPQGGQQAPQGSTITIKIV